MSKILNADIIAANDDMTMIDHLLAAYGQCKDPFAKHLIGLALMNEGIKIAQDLPRTTFLGNRAGRNGQ